MADRKIVLITGANKGLGYQAVKTLLGSKQKYHVFLGSRDFDKGRSAAETAIAEVKSHSTVEPLQLDIESDASIKDAFETVKSRVGKIDALINNAGVMLDQQIERGNMTVREAYNKSWDINVTGAHILTDTFLPLLLKSSDPRLIFNTSGVSSLTNAADSSHFTYKVPPAGAPKPVGTISYRAAKAGLNMVMLEWVRMLKNDGVKVWCVAPGFFATDIGEGDPDSMKKMGAGDPAGGGKALVDVLEGKRDADVGKVVNMAIYGTPVQPW
ncbi:short-chain dehydrogenase/reductase tropE [Colletotrichum spaethianum]|uniref:Short-chain dehydrogenase/reductase tropE n=1 Tax=Colletotrichum spaethianum TaxID=700344 RepID=A0AA37UJ56_9PEZI|nr:short-chain dehydrogenase/reductase tropE [Colletotrichum spaethianum]GKT47431.1 short-chain dehydrogenase/reductase tropE [Colletotrichum spaethianum]